jgi:hypothetical protein
MVYNRLILLILIFSFPSCDINKNTPNKNKEERQDKFYTETERGYLSRIPLIKPYELISPDNGFTWVYKSPFNEKKDKKIILENVSLVGIHDSIIVVYTDMTYLPGEMTKAWCIINTKDKSEKLFTTEESYLENIKKAVRLGFRLKDVTEVFKVYNDKKTLIW